MWVRLKCFGKEVGTTGYGALWELLAPALSHYADGEQVLKLPNANEVVALLLITVRKALGPNLVSRMSVIWWEGLKCCALELAHPFGCSVQFS